jgi:hypothetical protein
MLADTFGHEYSCLINRHVNFGDGAVFNRSSHLSRTFENIRSRAEVFLNRRTRLVGRVEARFEPRVNLQDMTLNPVAAKFIEFRQNFGPKSAGHEALLKLPEENQKLPVGLLVFLVRRTAVTFHAPFFLLEMHVGVILQKTNELKDEFGFVPVGVAVLGNGSQPVTIGDQHLVLRVNQRVSGFELFAPFQHVLSSGDPIFSIQISLEVSPKPHWRPILN